MATPVSTSMSMNMGYQFGGALNLNQTTSFLGVPLNLRLSYEKYPHPSLPALHLNVQSKARTRTEDRQARHSRIRKKVRLLTPTAYITLSLKLSISFFFS